MKKLWKWLFGTRKQQCNIRDVINLGCGCTNNLYHSDNKEWCYKEQKRIKLQKQPCLPAVDMCTCRNNGKMYGVVAAINKAT